MLPDFLQTYRMMYVTEEPISLVPGLPAGMYVIASKRTMRGTGTDTEAGEFPGYVYWEPPDEPADSGWRVLVGDETQEDADDPDAFQVNAVETLTTFHPELRQILRAGVRGTWVWNAHARRYVEADS